MVSPLASLVSGLGRQINPLENIGQDITNIQLGQGQRQLQQQQLQQDQFGLQQQQKQATQKESLQKAQFLNRLGKRLLQTDESQWGQVLGPNVQVLQQMGFNAEQLSGLTREQIEGIVAQTDAVVGPQTQGFTASQRERESLIADLQSNDPERKRSAQIALGLEGRAGIDAEQFGLREASKLDAQLGRKASIAGEVEEAKVAGKGEGGRTQTTIQSGIDAAQGIPVLRRTLELLNTVGTGGFQAASLRAKQAFGIESADEGELSANLGEAVLGDLRKTFGAAFTEREGARLERIRAGFGKSPETNRRLINQSLQIAMQAAQRAMKEAADSGDFKTAQRIQDVIDFKLEDQAPADIQQEQGPDKNQILRFDAQGNLIQ